MTICLICCLFASFLVVVLVGLYCTLLFCVFRIHNKKSRGSLPGSPEHDTDTYKSLEYVLRKKKHELHSLGTQRDFINDLMTQFKEWAEDLLQEFENIIDVKVKAEEERMKSNISQEIRQLEKSIKNLKHSRSNKEDGENMYNRSLKVCDEKETTGKSYGYERFSNMQNIFESAIEDFTYRINKTGNYLIQQSCKLFVQTDKIDMKLGDDRTTCDINDMCQLQAGILLCDWNNTKVKRLCNNYEIKDACLMPGIPWAICQTGPSEAAVSLFLLKRVQFLTVSSSGMKTTRNFTVGEVCRGICYTDNKLVVSCGGGGIGEGPGNLRIFNKSGTLLNRVQEKSHTDPVFSCPFHLTSSQGLVYLTDRDNGLICLQWNGLNNLKPAKARTSQHLALAKGICEGQDSELYICDFKNGRVVSLDTQTLASTVLIQQNTKLTGPQSLCYDHVNKDLVIASGDSNHILTYRLKIASRHT